MDFREAVGVPIGWVIVGGLFCVSTAAIFLIWLGPVEALAVLLGLSALIGGWLASLTYRVQVDDEGVRVGRGLLEWAWAGPATALDETETAELSGPRADARAWLKLPPYTRRAVRIDIEDADDPHPYWLVGTRRPEEFAAAVRSRRDDRAGDDN